MGLAQSSFTSGADRHLRRIEYYLRGIAARRELWICTFFVLPLLIRMALLPVIPIPQPGIQDEFSNLVAGDTFASGRLTNATHPMWVFFESVHILQQPTYMSKYPPLTGLLLGAGQWLFGQPWIGVLISMGALCSVLCWALQGWLPPVWALLGTVLGVLKIGILSYWTESYWGGAGAAVGGALLIGSMPRMIRAPTFRTGLPAAIGISLLMNSRPFEGAVLTVLCMSYVGWRVVRNSFPISIGVRALGGALAVPLLVGVAPIGSWSLFYNYRVTGDAWLLPYVAYERQYAVASAFFWQADRPVPAYRHEALRSAWIDWDLRLKKFQRQHVVLSRWIAYNRLDQFFLGLPLLGLVLLRGRPIARSRRLRPALWIGVLFLAALGLESDLLPHYAAPATALAYLMVAAALRSLRHARKHSTRWGAVVFPSVLALLIATLGSQLWQPSHRFLFDKRNFQHRRSEVLNYLDGIPARHLVFVHYGPKHDLNHEWVYNRADIDASPIVWARSMGLDADKSLLRYYDNRQAWLLDEDGAVRIAAYSAIQSRKTAACSTPRNSSVTLCR